MIKQNVKINAALIVDQSTRKGIWQSVPGLIQRQDATRNDLRQSTYP